MARAQFISNLGTIEISGTSQFMKAIEEGTYLSLINQFYVVFQRFCFRQSCYHIKI
jgi:HSP90 family molecular chaperone